MSDKEKDSKEEKEERYDWRGNVAVYSERHGWHLRPTEDRKEEERKVSSVSKEE
jgi:hypothetical protein|tara:strand:+ start:407 stop:568 length:162 start_codon:yes stop_codon:yes gene_type:complete